MGFKRSFTRALVAASAAALLAAGCGDTTAEGPSGTAPGGEQIDAAAQLAKAKEVSAAAIKGTERPVDPTSRPAVKGKKLAVITSAMGINSSKVPAEGAAEAAKALGWDVQILDAALQPNKYPELVRQAVSSGVNGIVLVAIDCNTAKEPLAEAKRANIAITAVYAYDCDDPRAGDTSDPLFAAETYFGPENPDNPSFTRKYGADQASYIIANSNNEAKVIVVNAPEFTVLNYTADGFTDTIKQSGGSEIVETLDVTQADLLNSQYMPKLQTTLQRHPEATWLKMPFTTATQLGMPALAQYPNLKVMGGEGFEEELEFLREGKIHAVNVISSTWNGWAAVDVLNSYWQNQKPVDSGIGWKLVDKDNGLPASGPIVPAIDFKAGYKKAWGVS